LWGAQVVVARERPFVAQCRADPEYAARTPDCHAQGEWNRSFVAGHTAVGVAMASLTCLHHGHLPLYGGFGDDLACGLSIGAAVVNGMGRVMTENHYTSDLLLGVGLGLFAGYVVPKTLHYGRGASRPREPGPGPGMVVLPTFSGDGFGLAILGRL
jgi:membrane-associated phospholipid phosphatase